MKYKNEYKLRVDCSGIELPDSNFEFSLSFGDKSIESYLPNVEYEEGKPFITSLKTNLPRKDILGRLRKNGIFFSLVFGNTWVVAPKRNIEIQFEDDGEWEPLESPFL